MGTRPVWRLLSRLESWALEEEIENQSISKPIYVTGIARSGTTIVTELIAKSPQITSHQYGDFPGMFTPYWRNWLNQRSSVSTPKSVERAHMDRITVSNKSPEAFEEVLWMTFDSALHNKKPITRIDPGGAPMDFLPFYRAHLKKLLLVRNRSRYLAKGNYNLLRLPWLHQHMDNPRIVLMTRNPIWHVASLMKQHKLFLAAQQHDSRTGRQLAASGHFEFGPLRRAPAYLGLEAQQTVTDLWAEGEEVRGWARLWAQGYTLALKYLADPQLASQILLVRYEDLCREPDSTIAAIAEHCQLDDLGPIAQQYASKLSPPDYYQPDFSGQELSMIASEVDETAAALGYEPVPQST